MVGDGVSPEWGATVAVRVRGEPAVVARSSEEVPPGGTAFSKVTFFAGVATVSE